MKKFAFGPLAVLVALAAYLSLWPVPVQPERGRDGGQALHEVLHAAPAARMWPIPKTFGNVFAFTEDGQVVANLPDPTGAYLQTTGVTETADRLCVQNLHLEVLGWKGRRASPAQRAGYNPPPVRFCRNTPAILIDAVHAARFRASALSVSSA